MNEFGKRLKMLREAKDISLAKLAEDIGSTKSALSRYENGKMDPGLKVLIKISEYFNVSLDWLSGNGDIDEIGYIGSAYKNTSGMSAITYYEKIFNQCMEENITPEKLKQIIDVLKK